MYRTFSALAAAAITVGAFALTAPAHAAPADEAITVSLERIDRRILSAARDLCGSRRLQPVRLMQAAAACEQAAVAEGRTAVQLAQSRSGSPFRLTLRAGH
jgi:hypothetical protein